MSEKYVQKRWIDSKMKYDPLYLYENKPNKFKKFVSNRMGYTADESKSLETPSQRATPEVAPVL